MITTARANHSGLSGDFRRLWAAYAVSELGTAIGAGALPLIAVLLLDVSDLKVSLLAALSGIASAAIALPAGSWIEFRRKRPVMVGADLVRFAALASVPVAAAFGALTYAQLCAVGVVQTAGTIVFNAASGAHLRNLVPATARLAANSRFETTLWTMTSAGPPIGGLLVSWVGATVTTALDAASYLLSALGVRSLRAPEPDPPRRAEARRPFADILGGWRHIIGHKGLRALFWNAQVFGGALMLSSPLLAVLMLRDMGLAPWQYGLALGLPGLGGVLGALVTRRLSAWLGERTVLLAFGVGRTLWLGFLAIAPTGTAGWIVIIVAETLLLFCAGVFNPTFVTYRMAVTGEAYMARVITAWSVSSKAVQPMFIAAGGLLAAATSARTAIGVASVVLLASAALLPWRTDTANPLAPPRDDEYEDVHDAHAAPVR